MFESGLGGDFTTYVGMRTGAIYRLDLGKVHCLHIPLERLLSPAMQNEGRLSQVPAEIPCKICGNVFCADTIPVDAEEMIDAYDL